MLVRPEPVHMGSFVAALERGWAPNSMLGRSSTDEELARVRADANAYLAAMDDREALRNPPFRLPDGSTVAPLPSLRRWMWDGEFCGSVSLRWQAGTMELPEEILGHIGYNVVPWKRGLGYARAALAQMLQIARAEGFPYVELTCDPDNAASRRVIEGNGGILVANFRRGAAFGGTEALRYRVALR
jgi:predicted acetyltransferase